LVRRVELIAVVLALVLAAGCATVPTSGPVEHHEPQQAGASNGVQVAPLPPADGATQLLVVEGFLHAMSTYEAGYQVARQYLTTDAAKRWHPEAGVQVYADGYPPTETDQTVVLIAPLTGTIDSTGVYRPASGQLRQDFVLVRNDLGQWRISNPPNGLVVSRYLFSTGFTSVDVDFVAATGDVMLPDPRYFPTGDSALSAAATAVVEGPSAWLSPLVGHGAVTGVTVDSVVLDSRGAASVHLGGTAEALSRDQRELLLAELGYTLTGFDQVRVVQVSADGELWVSKLGHVEVSPTVFNDLDPSAGSSQRTAFLARGDKLQRQASQTAWTEFTDVQSGLPALQGLAVSRSGEQWAGVAAGRSKLVAGSVSEKGYRAIRVGVGLLRPSYSRSGELWSPAASLAGLKVFRDSAAVAVTMRGVPNRKVVAAALSPDGDRLALVLSKGGLTTVGLVRVGRSDAGIVLDGWQELGPNLLEMTSSKLLDVGWNSISDLAVLRVDANRQTSVMVVSQDAAEVNDIGPSDASGLASLLVQPGRPAMAVSITGGLYRFDGEFNWVVSAGDVEAAAYSG
jgi:hypothetical protein